MTIQEELKAAEGTWVGMTLRIGTPFFGRLRDGSRMGEGRVELIRIDRPAMYPYWMEITALRLPEPSEGVPRTVYGETGTWAGADDMFWVKAEADMLSEIAQLILSSNTVYAAEALRMARLLNEDIRRLLDQW